MPSSWSSSLRFELQFAGENINLWGDKLNVVLQHADAAVAGWLTKALSGDYALTAANAADDEARTAMLKFTGAGAFTVTIPSVSKAYDVWNACSGVLTLTTGAGATAPVQPGERVRLTCDGANVYRVQPTDYDGQRVTSVGNPVNPQDAATKFYVDGVAWETNAGVLPGQSGNAGKVLFTDGAGPNWGLAVGTQTATTGAWSLLPADQTTALGGLKADTSGNVKLVNANGADRLVSATDGSVTAKSDAGVANVLATQAFAVALAAIL